MQDFRGVDSIYQNGAGTSHNRKGHGFREVQEYRLLVQPGLDICSQVEEERSVLRELFPGHPVTKPVVEIGVFLASEPMEETLIRWIQRVCSQQAGFMLSLNNYSGFPPHTIYLRVQDTQPIRELTRQLNIIDEYIRSSGYPMVNWIHRPHLDLSGRLTETQYAEAIREYAPKTFAANFAVKELALVRVVSGTSEMKLVNVFHLRQEHN